MPKDSSSELTQWEPSSQDAGLIEEKRQQFMQKAVDVLARSHLEQIAAEALELWHSLAREAKHSKHKEARRERRRSRQEDLEAVSNARRNKARQEVQTRLGVRQGRRASKELLEVAERGAAEIDKREALHSTMRLTCVRRFMALRSIHRLHRAVAGWMFSLRHQSMKETVIVWSQNRARADAASQIAWQAWSAWKQTQCAAKVQASIGAMKLQMVHRSTQLSQALEMQSIFTAWKAVSDRIRQERGRSQEGEKHLRNLKNMEERSRNEFEAMEERSRNEVQAALQKCTQLRERLRHEVTRAAAVFIGAQLALLLQTVFIAWAREVRRRAETWAAEFAGSNHQKKPEVSAMIEAAEASVDQEVQTVRRIHCASNDRSSSLFLWDLARAVFAGWRECLVHSQILQPTADDVLQDARPRRRSTQYALEQLSLEGFGIAEKGNVSVSPHFPGVDSNRQRPPSAQTQNQTDAEAPEVQAPAPTRLRQAVASYGQPAAQGNLDAPKAKPFKSRDMKTYREAVIEIPEEVYSPSKEEDNIWTRALNMPGQDQDLERLLCRGKQLHSNCTTQSRESLLALLQSQALLIARQDEEIEFLQGQLALARR
eukprot:gnl/MRDRNA2_/MRDRNA2_83070_c0_seq3.p1 gnl/MRDRNA2_/MRDRNA2_83070_c0~~gnl/MRDRNA2_/MRDRNA2_83070_c0_seq3.p1  ORF type:complete len:608 (+),score=132.10 gnl/MRDRNA2_/MRDRNA2_83070_c0_seq3:28-1824(+)